MRRWAALAAITASTALLLLRCGGSSDPASDDVPLPERGEASIHVGNKDAAPDVTDGASAPDKPVLINPQRLTDTV